MRSRSRSALRHGRRLTSCPRCPPTCCRSVPSTASSSPRVDTSQKDVDYYQNMRRRAENYLTPETGERGVQMEFIRRAEPVRDPVSPNLVQVIIVAGFLGDRVRCDERLHRAPRRRLVPQRPAAVAESTTIPAAGLGQRIDHPATPPRMRQVPLQHHLPDERSWRWRASWCCSARGPVPGPASAPMIMEQTQGPGQSRCWPPTQTWRACPANPSSVGLAACGLQKQHSRLTAAESVRSLNMQGETPALSDDTEDWGSWNHRRRYIFDAAETRPNGGARLSSHGLTWDARHRPAD